MAESEGEEPKEPESVHHGAEPHNWFEAFVMRMVRRWKKFRKKFATGPPPPEMTSSEKKLSDMAEIIQTYRFVDVDAAEDVNAPVIFVIWVDRPSFDMIMCCIIMMNTVAIGVELDAEYKAESRHWGWIMLEVFFMCAFSSEVYFKLKHHTFKWIIADGWNLFTTFVAGIAVIDCIILQAAGLHGQLRMLSLLRVIGIMRLLRIIKLFKALKELRLIMQGLGGSLIMLTWTTIILFAFLYVCAVFITSTVGRSPLFEDFKLLTNGWDHDELFGSVGRSMYTLMQCMTRDGWNSSIARYICVQQWYMGLFFLLFILFTTYGLLNLVVSVIVEQTLTAARSNQSRDRGKEEALKREELNGLKEIFLAADDDGSGELDINEFLAALEDEDMVFKMRSLDLPIDDAARLFTVMDGEGSRPLTMEEFIEGCTKLKGQAQSKDLLALTSQADSLSGKTDTLAEELQDCEKMLHQLDGISYRIINRFQPAIKCSRKKIAKSVGGSAPVVPMHPDKPGSAIGVDLGHGNRPLLPTFPNLLN